MADSEILKPGQNIRPKITLNEATELVKKLYGFRCKSICELDSYDDKNFKVTVQGNHEQEDTEYVLKILNSFDSKKTDVIQAQNELLLYLARNNINCPIPMQTIEGAYYSLEQLESGLHIIRLMKFIPGLILMKVPDVSASLASGIGKFVANLDKALEKFEHPAYLKYKSLWMLESVPELRKFLFAVEDELRRSMLEEIIIEFENRVLTKMDVLTKGLIHGDVNEQNIIVEKIKGEWQMKSLLDFGDSQYSCYLFELAITMTYVMILTKSVDLGGYVLKGYSNIRNVPDRELSLLKICIEARLVQSLVMGAYTSQLDPGNAYLLTTSKPGWELLFKLNSIKNEDILESWRKVLACQEFE